MKENIVAVEPEEDKIAVVVEGFLKSDHIIRGIPPEIIQIIIKIIILKQNNLMRKIEKENKKKRKKNV